MANKNNIDRYVRQYSLKNLSQDFQLELLKKTVLVIGAGATGSRSIDMLIRCGFGNIIIFDNDLVELQNLQRQHIYKESDVGKRKALLLKEYAKNVNSDVNIEAVDGFFDEKSGERVFNEKKIDIILDCTDNFKTRFVINKFAVSKKIPAVFQALAGSNGFVFPYIPGKTCLACFNKEDIDKKDELNANNSGLFSPVCNVATGLAVSLMFAIINNEKIESIYTSMDVWYPFSFKKYSVEKDPDCKVCSTKHGKDKSKGNNL